MQLPANERAKTTPSKGRTVQIRVHLLPGIKPGWVHITDAQLIRRYQDRTPLDTRWLLLITSSAEARSICSIAKVNSGKYCCACLQPKGTHWIGLVRMDRPSNQLPGRRDSASIRTSICGTSRGCSAGNQPLEQPDRRNRRSESRNTHEPERCAAGGGPKPRTSLWIRRTLRSLSAHCRSSPGSRCWYTCPARTSPSTSSWRRRWMNRTSAQRADSDGMPQQWVLQLFGLTALLPLHLPLRTHWKKGSIWGSTSAERNENFIRLNRGSSCYSTHKKQRRHKP